METFNPSLFIWARETAGLSPEEAATALKLAPSTLEKIESGLQEPSDAALARMSHVYRRSPAVFYLSSPPTKGERGHDFRSVQASRAVLDEVRLDSLTREIMSRHAIIRSTVEDYEDRKNQLPIGKFVGETDPSKIRNSISTLLKISTSEYRSKRTVEEGFSYLRSACERNGIFVVLIGNLGSHHTNIPASVFRGFAIADPVCPMVVINDQDAKPAWPFTLLHEIAHLWIGQTGISAGFSEHAVEVLCNNVAGEFLLPPSDIQHIASTRSQPELLEITSDVAKRAKVSRPLVAYRLYLYGKIDLFTWTVLDGELRKLGMIEKEKAKEAAGKKDTGPDYFVVRRHRMGALTQFVQNALGDGYMTTVKAAKVLGVSPRSLQTMIEGA